MIPAVNPLINYITFSFASHLTEVEKRRGYPRQILKGMYKTIKNLQTTPTPKIVHRLYPNMRKLH